MNTAAMKIFPRLILRTFIDHIGCESECPVVIDSPWLPVYFISFTIRCLYAFSSVMTIITEIANTFSPVRCWNDEVKLHVTSIFALFRRLQIHIFRQRHERWNPFFRKWNVSISENYVILLKPYLSIVSMYLKLKQLYYIFLMIYFEKNITSQSLFSK